MQRRVLAHELFDGIDGVEATRPEVLVVPGVLADGDGEPSSVELDDLLRSGRRKVALLIENVIERQQPLVLFKKQVAAVDEYGGVKCWFAVFAPGGQSYASQNGCRQVARGGSKLVDRRPAARQKAGLLEQICRRIAADGKLGKHGEASA